MSSSGSESDNTPVDTSNWVAWVKFKSEPKGPMVVSVSSIKKEIIKDIHGEQRKAIWNPRYLQDFSKTNWYSVLSDANLRPGADPTKWKARIAALAESRAAMDSVLASSRRLSFPPVSLQDVSESESTTDNNDNNDHDGPPSKVIRKALTPKNANIIDKATSVKHQKQIRQKQDASKKLADEEVFKDYMSSSILIEGLGKGNENQSPCSEEAASPTTVQLERPAPQSAGNWSIVENNQNQDSASASQSNASLGSVSRVVQSVSSEPLSQQAARLRELEQLLEKERQANLDLKAKASEQEKLMKAMSQVCTQVAELTSTVSTMGNKITSLEQQVSVSGSGKCSKREYIMSWLRQLPEKYCSPVSCIQSRKPGIVSKRQRAVSTASKVKILRKVTACH